MEDKTIKFYDEDDMRDYLCRLDKVKPVVFTGDLNVAHEEKDLKNPKIHFSVLQHYTEQNVDRQKILSTFLDFRGVENLFLKVYYSVI